MIVFTFVSVIAILFLSYWLTKYIGTKTMRHTTSKHMEIVDRLPITQDKSVIILKAEKKYYLLSLSQNDIRLIKELTDVDEDAFQVVDETQTQGEFDFKTVLTQYFPNKNK
ncbi:MAG: FliO/MopB family protein [Anaerotignum sp.]